MASISGMFRSISDGITNIETSLRDGLMGMFNSIIDFLEVDLRNMLNDFFDNFFENIATFFAGKFDDLVSAIQNNSDQIKDFFGITNRYSDTGTIGVEDGRFTILIKDQTTRMITELEGLFNGISEALDDLEFYIMGINRDVANISEVLETLDTKFSLQTNRIIEYQEDLIGLFDIADNSYGLGGIRNADGDFTKLIKGQTGRIINPLNDLIDSIDSVVNAIIVGSEEIIKEFDIFNIYKRPYSSDIEWAESDYYSSGDGAFTKLIKGQTNRIVDSSEDILNALDNGFSGIVDNLDLISDAILDQVYVHAGQVHTDIARYENGELYWEDGNLTKLLKAQTNRVIAALGEIELISDIDERVEDLLKDIVDAIAEIPIMNEAGSTIWDFLGDILDFLENMVDRVVYLVIPEDTTFITETFNAMNEDLRNKFNFISELQIVITDTFNVSEKEFDDFYINFPVFGEIKVMDTTYFSGFISVVRQMLSGLIILLTALWAYRKITGTGGIIE